MIKNEFDFFYFLKQFFFIYLLIISNTVVSNIFEIGIDDYTKTTDYVVGGLNDLWNSYTYSLIFLPLLLFYKTNKKFILYLCSFLILVFLLISLKRIAILGVGFAGLGFVFFLGVKAKNLKRVFLFGVLLLATSPFYLDLLVSRIQIRAEQGRFKKDFYEDEGRYIEFQYIIDNAIKFDKPFEIFLGLKSFDSRGIVGDGDRQFHVDYTLIIFTLGFLGLILYLFIYLRFFKIGFNILKKITISPHLKRKYYLHISTFFVLLTTSLVTSIGGQMYHVTFRMMIFLSLGAILKLLLVEIKKINFDSYAFANRL